MGFTKIQMLLIVKKKIMRRYGKCLRFVLRYSKLICRLLCPVILIGMFDTNVLIKE